MSKIKKEAKSFAAIYKSLSRDPQYLAEKLATDFLFELNRCMKRDGVSNGELAQRLDVSPAYISKVFGGTAGNMSLETLAKLALALDQVVHVHLAPCESEVKWFECYGRANLTPARQPNPSSTYYSQAAADLLRKAKVMSLNPSNESKYVDAA